MTCYFLAVNLVVSVGPMQKKARLCQKGSLEARLPHANACVHAAGLGCTWACNSLQLQWTSIIWISTSQMLHYEPRRGIVILIN